MSHIYFNNMLTLVCQTETEKNKFSFSKKKENNDINNLNTKTSNSEDKDLSPKDIHKLSKNKKIMLGGSVATGGAGVATLVAYGAKQWAKSKPNVIQLNTTTSSKDGIKGATNNNKPIIIDKENTLTQNISPPNIQLQHIDISKCENREEIIDTYKQQYISIIDALKENINKFDQVYNYKKADGSYDDPIIARIQQFETIMNNISTIQNISCYMKNNLEIYNMILSLEQQQLINSNNIFVLQWKYQLNNILTIFNESLDIMTTLINNKTVNIDAITTNSLRNNFDLIKGLDIHIERFNANSEENGYNKRNIGMMISKIMLSNKLQKINDNLYNAFCIISLLDMPLSYDTNNKTYISLLLSNNTHLNEIVNKYHAFFNTFDIICSTIYANSKDSVNHTSNLYEKSKQNLLNIEYYFNNNQFKELFDEFIDNITKNHETYKYTAKGEAAEEELYKELEEKIKAKLPSKAEQDLKEFRNNPINGTVIKSYDLVNHASVASLKELEQMIRAKYKQIYNEKNILTDVNMEKNDDSISEVSTTAHTKVNV